MARAAVVVPTHNRADALRRALASLVRHGPERRAIERDALRRLPEAERARASAVETRLWLFSRFFKEHCAWAGRR